MRGEGSNRAMWRAMRVHDTKPVWLRRMSEARQRREVALRNAVRLGPLRGTP